LFGGNGKLPEMRAGGSMGDHLQAEEAQATASATGRDPETADKVLCV